MLKCLVIALMLLGTLGDVEGFKIPIPQTQKEIITSFEENIGHKIAMPKFLPFEVKETETKIHSEDQMEVRCHGYKKGQQILLSIKKENKKFDRIKHYHGAPYAKNILLKDETRAILLNKEYTFKSLIFVDSGIEYQIIDFTGDHLASFEKVANSML